MSATAPGGLVALGDSITRGRCGEHALDIPFRSWAHWVAEALDVPFHNLAADGATAPDVLAGQVPRLAGPYAVATLFIGANDARGMTWDPAAYERDVRAILAALHEAAGRVLVLTVPEDLGRPTAAPKPAQANAVLRGLDAEIVELADFGGRRHMIPDAVHPTSAGMAEIARRALRILSPETEWTLDPPYGATGSARRRDRLRYEVWWWRLWSRDVRRRRRERRAAQ